MKPIKSLDDATHKVLKEARQLLDSLRRHIKTEPITVAEAIFTLSAIRQEVYEDLNQLQHEYLILAAAQWLRENDFITEEHELYWNPRQTGDDTEPDLAARQNGSPVVSAEITASKSPKGTIDTRMAKTLAKLNTMEGIKFYFVATEEMYQRAATKIGKAKYMIRVVKLQNEATQL